MSSIRQPQLATIGIASRRLFYGASCTLHVSLNGSLDAVKSSLVIQTKANRLRPEVGVSQPIENKQRSSKYVCVRYANI